MSFPARERFDQELRDPEGRLYAYCRKHLTFHRPREIKGWVVARALDMKRENVTRMLTRLVTRGFLVEYPRKANEPRRFTLVYDDPKEQVPPTDTHPDGSAE